MAAPWALRSGAANSARNATPVRPPAGLDARARIPVSRTQNVPARADPVAPHASRVCTQRACDLAQRRRTWHACTRARRPLPRRVAHAQAARLRTRAAQTHLACVRERRPVAPTRRACARSAHANAYRARARGMRARA
eukprot:1650648-Pleurochrysis_carterae.AAC.1